MLYEEIISIRESGSSSLSAVVDILKKQNINLRGASNNSLCQINCSVPLKVENSFVVGLRYKKLDNSYAEDLFVIKKDTEVIICYYKGKQEEEYDEYSGTHHAEPGPVYSTANTITLNL